MLGTNTSMFIDMQYIEDSGISTGGFRRQFLRDDLGETCHPWSDVPHAEHCERSNLFTRASDFSYDYQNIRDRRIASIRHCLREQTRYKPTTRWQGVACGFATLKQSLKDFAKAVQDDDDTEVLEQLNLIARYSSHIASKIYYDHCRSFDFFQCDDCGGYFHYEEQRTTSDDTSICGGCRDAYCYSDCMDVYIPDSHACPVYDSVRSYRDGSVDDYCTSRYGRNNFQEYDDAFFSDDDAYYEVSNEGCEDEYEYEDDDRPSNDGLSSYHNGYRDFTEINASGKYPSLGAEIEVYCEDRADVVSDLKDIGGLVLERDSSLDDYNGFEIITKPYGREEWAHMTESIFNTLQDHDAIGYNEPAGENYGIHLTVHRRFLSPLSEARIAMFLVDDVNQNFVRAIAQRAQIYSAHNGVGIGEVRRPRLGNVSSGFHGDYSPPELRGKMQGRGKYCPVNFKEELAEFRIFQSTTNSTSFVKNLEFVWALIKWTNSSTGCSHHHRDFLLWLNTPQQRNEFHVLSTFLSKRSFYGTNFSPIISNWQTLIRKPLQTEAVEPMAA